MAKTYLDQLVEFPVEVIRKICSDKYCVGLLVNKPFDGVEEKDYDAALDKYVYDYQYVDETVETSSAYVMVETEINSVENRQFKGVRIYITVACHKTYMRLDGGVYRGVIGNRRDNLVRYIDRLLNGLKFLGVGALSLKTVKTLSPFNGFTAREIVYAVPDFNIVELNE